MMPAQPEPEHARHFANLAQIASDQFYSQLLGSKANAILASTFQHPNNDNSYVFTNFLMADDSIAGMLNGFTAGQKQAIGNQTEWLILKYGTWRFLRYLTIGILLSDITDFIGKRLADGDYYIQMVAIYPQFRGRGYSKTILTFADEIAVSQGCNRLVLDVDERNTIAINAYRKVGFEVVGESKKTHIDGKPWGLLRMAKPIQASK
jgi:ribosomal protein S18 acetylase RimI-like enzyme